MVALGAGALGTANDLAGQKAERPDDKAVAAAKALAERRSLRLRSEELARTLAKLGTPERQVADTFQKAGSGVEETATVLRAVGVPMREAAEDLDGRYGNLGPERMRTVLTSAGYSAAAPALQRYFIVGHEKVGSTAQLADVGIVDPARVGGAGSPSDGVVTIEGQGLDDPGLSVSIEHAGGSTQGVIQSVQTGWVRVAFSDFGSGELIVATTGGAVRRPVAALSHATLGVIDLFAPKPSFTFAGGRALLTWPLASTSETSADFSPPADIQITVTGDDEDPALSLPPSSGSDLTLQAVFNVPAATLIYRARVVVHPGGSLSVVPGAPDYQGALFATVPVPSYASRTTLTSWWNGSVVPRLLELNVAFTEALSRRLSNDPVKLVPGLDPDAELMGVHAQSPSQVRLVFRH